MLVAKPQETTYQGLSRLAQRAKGHINRLYLHWTAGTYNAVYDDYHICINGAGQLFITCQDLWEKKAHTYRRNTGSIGIALCCARNAIGYSEQYIDFGTHPPTQPQIEAMAKVIAILAENLGLEITPTTVMTHCEAAIKDGYGPYSGDEDLRWDLWQLPDLPLAQGLKPGGDVLRGKALWYQQQ